MKKHILGLLVAITMGAQAFAASPFTVPNDTITLGKTGSTDKVIEANLTKQGAAANPKQRYNHTTAKWEFANDGVNFKGLGSGSGVTNFVINNQGDAESTGTTGWACYVDTAGAAPLTGTGGSPHITFTQSTSTPLIGTGSFLYTKDAANRQGEGCSYQFGVDLGYKAKVLQIEFDYLVSSGTFTPGTQSVDSDMTVWIYDVTNSVMIQPSTYKVYSNSTGLSAHVISNFQTSATGSTYRLILHNGNTGTSAYTLKLDNVQVTPSVYTYGTPITDWVSYTPTGAWSSNITYTGKWRRVGDSMQVQTQATLSGAGTNANFTFSMPSGFTIDTTKFPSTPQQFYTTMPSAAANYQHGGAGLPSYVVYYDTTHVNVSSLGGSAPVTGGQYTATAPFTWGSGDYITASWSAPIAGWSSSVQMSSDSETRVVAAHISTALTTTINNTQPFIVYDIVDFDTHGAYNASTGVYKVPVPGYYQISGMMNNSGAGTSIGQNNLFNLSVFKNGSDIIDFPWRMNAAGTLIMYTSGSNLVKLAAGDLLTFKGYCDSSTSLGGSASGNWISIQKVNGPAAIAANESVNASYFSTAATSIANSGSDINVPFAIKSFDSHLAYNTSTGIYTVQAPGKYDVDASIQFASSAYASGNQLFASVYKNGSIYAYGPINTLQASVTAALGASAHASVPCITGDTLEVRVSNNRTAGATSMATNTGFNHMEIKRIGL